MAWASASWDVPAKTSCECRCIIVAQEPDGTTDRPVRATQCPERRGLTRRAAAANLVFHAGCPQHAPPWAVRGEAPSAAAHERRGGSGQALGTQLLDEAGRKDDGPASRSGHVADVRRAGARDPWDAERVARAPSHPPPRRPRRSRAPG